MLLPLSSLISSEKNILVHEVVTVYSMSFDQIQIQAVQKAPSEKSQIRENRQTLLRVPIY